MGGKTRTSRIGNGAGYGGEAKGMPARGERPAFAEGNTMGQLPVTRAPDRMARSLEIEQFWDDVRKNDDIAIQNRLKASENLHRADRPDLYRNVPERETAEVQWYIEGVAEAVSVDDWVQQAQLARAKPQGSAD